MVQTAPVFSSIALELLQIVQGCIFVAHNARFDYGFIKNEFARIEKPFTMKTLCTVKLSRALYPQYKQHNLDVIITRHALQVKERHRAMGDTQAILDFYIVAKSTIAPKTFNDTLKTLLGQPTLPAYIKHDVIQALPETPGVYYFYGEGSRPIYIGKSTNIKKRVLSHFSGAHTTNKGTKITQEIRAIEYQETIGELGALLLESKRIKQWQPIYNRKQRNNAAQCAIQLTKNSHGYLQPSFIPTNTISNAKLSTCYGVYTTKKAAEKTVASLTKEYSLCEAVMKIEKSTPIGQPCFKYHLRQCNGACIKQESTLEHNIRVQNAFRYLQHSTWPFNGIIAITEHTPNGSVTYFIQDWCFIGSTNSNSQTITTEHATFDIEQYQLIKQFLKQAQHKSNVKTSILSALPCNN